MSKKQKQRQPSQRISKIKQIKKEEFLKAFANLGTITYACRHVGITRKTHYDWLKADLQYAADFHDAEYQATDRLEQEARRRATVGTDELVLWQGKPVLVDHPDDAVLPEKQRRQAPLVKKTYSDTLLIFLLKGARPEKYRERWEVSGAGGGPVEIVNTARERLLQILQQMHDAQQAGTVKSDSQQKRIPAQSGK